MVSIWCWQLFCSLSFAILLFMWICFKGKFCLELRSFAVLCPTNPTIIMHYTGHILAMVQTPKPLEKMFCNVIIWCHLYIVQNVSRVGTSGCNWVTNGLVKFLVWNLTLARVFCFCWVSSNLPSFACEQWDCSSKLINPVNRISNYI